MTSRNRLTPADIVRAWKDEAFRSRLTDRQRAALPAHPAGLIELSDAQLDQAAGGLGKAGGTTMFGATCDRWTVGCGPIIC